MRLAITGGTGLVGRALVRALTADRHEVVIVSRHPDSVRVDAPEELVDRVATSVTDRDGLIAAFDGCDAVAHLAGINREVGDQTFEDVHVRGTRAVVEAATDAGTRRVAVTSYLRARPDCGAAYLESKWRAEEIVRDAHVDGTVLKPGVVYGAGDQFVTHVARALATVPVFPTVSFSETRLRPVAVEDLAAVLAASVTTDRLTAETVPVLGPETLTLADAVRRIGSVVGRDPVVFPLPAAGHVAFASVLERVMETPVIARSQVRMLREDLTEPAPAGVCTPLPEDLAPDQPFTRDRIEGALAGGVSRYGLGDLSV